MSRSYFRLLSDAYLDHNSFAFIECKLSETNISPHLKYLKGKFKHVNCYQIYFFGKIILSQQYIELFTTGKISTPQFGNQFPAQKIETQLNWEDIILSPETHQQIKDIENWVNHFEKLKQNDSMKKQAN